MGITFRHDAAAVVPPSNASTRKYGQQLVQQEQQRKYLGQQAGYDRLFQLGRDNMQNQAQILRDNNQIVHQTNLAKGQQAFQLDRDKQQNDWQQQQNRAADFKAARARMDAHAKDALSNPDIPPELRNKIQSLINGKMAVLGSGFNEAQQQQFLDQYNSQLAALLSEIPPAQPKAPAQPNFHTDDNGNRWVQEGPDKWKQVPPQEQQPQKPTSPGEAFQDKKTLDDYYKKADDYITGGDPDNRPKVPVDPKVPDGEQRPMTPQEYHAHVNKIAGDLWGIDNPQGSATAAPPLPGAAQAPASPPEMKSILETPADMTVTPPDQGVPPAPPASNQMAQDWATKGGFKPAPDATIQSDGKVFYVPTTTGPMATFSTEEEANRFLNGGQAPAAPPAARNQQADILSRIDERKAQAQPPAPPAAPQDIWGDKQPSNQPAYPPSDWEELMAGTPSSPSGPLYGEGRDSVPPGPLYGEGPPSLPPGPSSVLEGAATAPQAAAPKAPAPDFGSLTANATDDGDRFVLGKLQGIYGSQPPEVQSAIDAFVNPDATKQQRALALRAIKAAGIDLSPDTSVKEKTQEKMQDKYGSTWDSF